MTTKENRFSKFASRVRDLLGKTKRRTVAYSLVAFLAIFVLIAVMVYSGLGRELFSFLGNNQEPLVIEETTLEDFQSALGQTDDQDEQHETKSDQGAPDMVHFEDEESTMVATEDDGESVPVTASPAENNASEPGESGEAIPAFAPTTSENVAEGVREVTEGVKPAAFSVWDLLQPIEGEILTPYGWHKHPLLGNWKFHRGVDIKADLGVPVKVAFAGKVLQVSQDDYYGLRVEIRHDNGYRTVYAQLQEVRVTVGDILNQGQIIGSVGQTGLATTPHLHFEVIEGNEPVDPLQFLQERY
ncbi:MAG: M23 family metallopeptidase [Halanaerobium sp.]|nr:M23 family metallopeptidase [Halanaerobium sp.]